MRLPSTFLNRLLSLALLGLFVLAVRLGRDEGEPRPQTELGASPHRWAAGQEVLIDPQTRPYISLLNRETGRVAQLPHGDRQSFAYAVCSPWQDGRGRRHVVAQWRGLDRNGQWAAGLARYAFPGGEILDRFPLEVPSFGPACWVPDLAATIHFAGIDGRLYFHSFGGKRKPGRSADEVVAPRPVVWKCPLPGAAVLRIIEPSWLLTPQRGRILLVAMAIRKDPADTTQPEHPELWWLRLSVEGHAVEAAGRLLRSRTGTWIDPDEEQHFPRIATTAEGHMILAYFVRRRGDMGLQLRLAPVGFDEEIGGPWAEASRVRILADGLASSPPVFSKDGHRVFAVARARLDEVQQDLPMRVQSYSILDAFPECRTPAEGASPAPTQALLD